MRHIFLLILLLFTALPLAAAEKEYLIHINSADILIPPLRTVSADTFALTFECAGKPFTGVLPELLIAPGSVDETGFLRADLAAMNPAEMPYSVEVSRRPVITDGKETGTVFRFTIPWQKMLPWCKSDPALRFRLKLDGITYSGRIMLPAGHLQKIFVRKAVTAEKTGSAAADRLPRQEEMNRILDDLFTEKGVGTK